MLRQALRGAVAVVAVPLLASCVSYNAYKNLRDENARLKDANRDLVAKYNRALLDARRTPDGAPVAGVSPAEHEALKIEYASLKEALENERRLRSVAISQKHIAQIPDAEEEDGGIRLAEGLLFDSGEARLKASQLPVLDQIARMLAANYPGQPIIIEGHTDNVPLRSTKNLYLYNLNLGYQRAYQVFEYLHKKHGFPEDQFHLVTYGMTKPVDPQSVDTEEGRRKNRRVVIRIGPQSI